MVKITKLTKSFAAIIGVVAAGAMLATLTPSAFGVSSSAAVVTSSRAFPKGSTVRKNLLAESVSTSVASNTNWGGLESLNVPQTKSQAQKDAEAAAKAAADAAAKAQAAAQANAAAAAANAAAASRSSTRTPIGQAVAAPNGKTAAALVSYASQFVGRAPYVLGGNTPAGWDCSGMVQYVFAQFGIALPRTSGGQMGVGSAVNGIANAQPGDIIATAGHAAIYIGGGLVVNAENPSAGTTQIPLVWVFPGSYAIRRVL